MTFSFRLHKKASTPDTFFWLCVVFALAMLLPIGLYMFQQINGTVANNDLFPQEFRNNVGDINNRFPSLFDGILAFIFMGVMAGSIVLALFIDTNPAFFFISLFIMVAMIIVGTILANVYDIQANSGVLAAQAQQFPITGFIMNNFVYLIVIYGFVISIVVYAKVRG